MYKRNLYLDKIRPFINKPVIKVITGMRRVGKSCFLRQLIADFKESGVPEENILYIDKESLDFDHIKTYKDLNQAAMDALDSQKGNTYLLIDEIQEIHEWERAVASLAQREGIDIYITGSNAHLFSEELATLLSGRYIEFSIYSLSFKEFRLFRDKQKKTIQDDFLDYIRFGGLPGIHHFDFEDETIFQYVSSVFNTILLKDVVKRHNIRNVQLLESIARFLFDNTGNILSAKRIADYFKSQRLKISVDTVQNYLGYFMDALAVHKVSRFDIKGKRLLELYDKYYSADIGIRHALLGYREADISGILENMVFMELKRRGYNVSIGKLDDREIDFIAVKADEKIYIQVCYLLASAETVEREFSPFLDIPDNYPKIVLSMDTAFGEDYKGIKRIDIRNFLLEKEEEEK